MPDGIRRLKAIGLWALSQLAANLRPHASSSGLEGVWQQRMLLIRPRHLGPVNMIRTGLALNFAHQAAARVSAGVSRRAAFGRLEIDRVPNAVAIRQRESQTAVGVNLVELQILRGQPWIGPVQLFVSTKLCEQILLPEPIHN